MINGFVYLDAIQLPMRYGRVAARMVVRFITGKMVMTGRRIHGRTAANHHGGQYRETHKEYTVLHFGEHDALAHGAVSPCESTPSLRIQGRRSFVPTVVVVGKE